MKNTSPIVIKFGGEVVEDEGDLTNLLLSVKELHNSGEKIVLIHGGGPLATKISKKMNLEITQIGGRRVTDQATLDVMKMTLPGIINSNVLAMMKKLQIPGASVSGITFIKCHKRPPKAVSGSNGEIIDFGFVGDLDGSTPDLINTLLTSNYVPVISPLCSDKDGTQLNINADTISVETAKALKAKKLVLVTKIGGVFEDITQPETRLPTLTIKEAQDKIAASVIAGGMIPKIEEGFKLLRGHLDCFHIVGVAKKDSILNEIKNPGMEGTAIIP